MAKLHELRPSILDWRVVAGAPTLFGKTSYRIVEREDGLCVQKRTTGAWRNDNGFSGASVEELVDEISEKT
jgi:hypothetical protein